MSEDFCRSQPQVVVITFPSAGFIVEEGASGWMVEVESNGWLVDKESNS